MVTTACLPCRKVKMRCLRVNEDSACRRCERSNIRCEVVPRRLGRQPGSKNKNRPKHGASGGEPSRRALSSVMPKPPTPVQERWDQGPRSSPVAVSPVQGSTGHTTLVGARSLVSSDPPAQSPTTEEDESPGASFNMLSVLARVANDQPDTYDPEDPSPSVLRAESPFDRNVFLAEFRRDAAHLDPDPYAGVALLEEGLAELYPLREMSGSGAPTRTGDIMHGRLDCPRLDVGAEYDIIGTGILTRAEIDSLAEVYWARIQPVSRVLDPDIHTVDYLLSQSALLTGVVLTIAAQCLPVSDHANSLVARLEGHVELMFTQIDKHGFQSMEICQALILFCLFMGHQVHRTWGMTGKAIAMAVELHLDVSPPPEWVFTPSPHHSATRVALKRNPERIWIQLVDWDRAHAFIRGRRPMIDRPSCVEPDRLRVWCMQPGAQKCDPYSVAFVLLLDIVVGIQFSTARLLVQHGLQFDFAAHAAKVDGAIDDWRPRWLPLLSEKDQNRILLDMDGLRLILLMMPYEYGLRRSWPPATTAVGRDACLATAQQIITRALPILSGADPVLKIASLYSYRYYRIAYAGFTMLRMINTAPRRRSDDVYLMSVVAALARRFVDVRLHANLAKVTSLLGRRLLEVARQLAATRLTPNVPVEADALNSSAFLDGVPWLELMQSDDNSGLFPALSLNGMFGASDFDFERHGLEWGSLGGEYGCVAGLDEEASLMDQLGL